MHACCFKCHHVGKAQGTRRASSARLLLCRSFMWDSDAQGSSCGKGIRDAACIISASHACSAACLESHAGVNSPGLSAEGLTHSPLAWLSHTFTLHTHALAARLTHGLIQAGHTRALGHSRHTRALAERLSHTCGGRQTLTHVRWLTHARCGTPVHCVTPVRCDTPMCCHSGRLVVTHVRWSS